MEFDDFQIGCSPRISGSCRHCRCDLKNVPNGWFSEALYCYKCDLVYIPKLVALAKDKVNKGEVAKLRKKIEENAKK